MDWILFSVHLLLISLNWFGQWQFFTYSNSIVDFFISIVQKNSLLKYELSVHYLFNKCVYVYRYVTNVFRIYKERGQFCNILFALVHRVTGYSYPVSCRSSLTEHYSTYITLAADFILRLRKIVPNGERDQMYYKTATKTYFIIVCLFFINMTEVHPSIWMSLFVSVCTYINVQLHIYKERKTCRYMHAYKSLFHFLNVQHVLNLTEWINCILFWCCFIFSVSYKICLLTWNVSDMVLWSKQYIGSELV